MVDNPTTADLADLEKYEIYQKSNLIISSKYRMTVTANRLMAIASSIYQHSKKDEMGERTCCISTMVLKKLIPSSNNGSFYSQLEEAAQELTSLSVGLPCLDDKDFRYMTPFNNVIYHNGLITMVLNRDYDEFMHYQKNYTNLNLFAQISFPRYYASRIYEICKSKMYYAYESSKLGEDNKKHYIYRVGLSELKFTLGVLDASDSGARKYLKGKNPDYDKAAKAVSKKVFATWTSFKRGVLDHNVEMVNNNELSDIFIKFEAIHGAHNAVVGVEFDISEKDGYVTKKNLIESQIPSDDVKWIAANIKLKLSKEEIKILLKEAKGDSSKVIEKVSMCQREMKTQRKKIKNPMAWIRMAIRSDYKDIVSLPDGHVCLAKDVYVMPNGDEVDINLLEPDARDDAMYRGRQKYPSVPERIIVDSN